MMGFSGSDVATALISLMAIKQPYAKVDNNFGSLYTYIEDVSIV